MPRFRIAHINEQGKDIIIVPLDRDFESKSNEEQAEICAELQERALLRI